MARELTQWIVSQRDDYLWQSRAALRGVEELRYLCVSREFSPARFAALVRYRHSTKQGDTYGVTGDARPFKRGDYAAIFASWTGRADGSMLKGEI